MNRTNVLLLYGLPCSGKSSVSRAMTDHHTLAVDAIIKKIINDPSIADFDRLSNDIVEDLVKEINNTDSNNYLIEMGCLIPKKAIDRLEFSLAQNGCDFINILLSADEDVLVQRIIARNRDIDSGNSNSIKVDGPDYLTRFKLVFDNNQPDELIKIDTTAKTTAKTTEKIISAITRKQDPG